MSTSRIFGLVVFLLATSPIATFADNATPGVVCIHTATGRMVTRAKCKANETRFSSSSYNGRIDPIATSVSSLQGSVTSLQGNATTLQSDVTSLQGSVTSLQGNVSTVQGSVTSLQTDMTAIEGDVISLQGSVNAIPQPARILHVATSGAPYTTIASALTDASALTPTATNPVVIKVGPGSYSLSSSGETIPSFVHLQGSGIGATNLLVTGPKGLSIAPFSHISRFTLNPAALTVTTFVDDLDVGTLADIEDISIEGQLAGNSGPVTGIELNTLDVRIKRVRIDLTNAMGIVKGLDLLSGSSASIFDLVITLSATSTGYGSGLLANGGDVTISDSSIDVSSPGGSFPLTTVRIVGSPAFIAQNVRLRSTIPNANSIVKVSGATSVFFDNCYFESTANAGGSGVIFADSGGKIEIRNSTVIGDSSQTGLAAYDSGTIVRVSGSFISTGATVASNGGSVKCSAATDGNYDFFPSTCPS